MPQNPKRRSSTGTSISTYFKKEADASQEKVEDYLMNVECEPVGEEGSVEVVHLGSGVTTG